MKLDVTTLAEGMGDNIIHCTIFFEIAIVKIIEFALERLNDGYRNNRYVKKGKRK